MKKSIKLFIYLFSVILLAFSTGEVEAEGNIPIQGTNCPSNMTEAIVSYDRNNGDRIYATTISAWLADSSAVDNSTTTIIFQNPSLNKQITTNVKKNGSSYKCFGEQKENVVKESTTNLLENPNKAKNEVNNFLCQDLESTSTYKNFLKPAYTVIKIAAPSLVVILGVFDFAGAITADDQDKMKKAQSKFVKRLIAGIIIFFLPMLINAVLKLAVFNSSTCGIG